MPIRRTRPIAPARGAALAPAARIGVSHGPDMLGIETATTAGDFALCLDGIAAAFSARTPT